MEKQKMLELRGQRWMWAGGVLMVSLLAGCASTSRTPAPVEDRSAGSRAAQPTVATDAAKPLPGAENVGKPGYYTVRPGDTLIRIALDAGQNWRDIARWNTIDNPNVIEVGQVLRVVPPAVAITERPASTPVAARPVASGSVVATAPSTNASNPAAVPPVALPAPAPASAPDVDDVPFSWPTAPGDGVIVGFDEQKNKGIDIAGKPGDPVLASADGRVVYA